MDNLSNLDLLNELGVDTTPKKKANYSPREERIIAGFEEIQTFVKEHDRQPQHGEKQNIFERLYAMRLEQIRKQAECRELLQEFDYQELLKEAEQNDNSEKVDDETLLTSLGVEALPANDMTQLQHVKPRAEVNSAEEIANREKCVDFAPFKARFQNIQNHLKNGAWETRPFKNKEKNNANIKQGDFFILAGQKVYVAEVGETFKTEYGRPDSRLRVIYDNATESDILLRSLQRALHKDQTSRRIIAVSHGPLFSAENETDAKSKTDDDDQNSGTIYVLRSKSEHPMICENREIIHKIGVTGNDVKKRIANAKQDATFLLAEVEIVATYQLYNIHRSKLENLLHTFFNSAKLKIKINDRFGKPVEPREWFLVPLFIIDDVVKKIEDKTLDQYQYDQQSAMLIKRIQNIHETE
ncbi:MAG: GIY-YIG nuclease family protein [Gammaproteobacteria bacterium]|nr:GIY-YIG nuclease family protein [Gammaproteobacteria bacterium]